ncbi:hypothetical protein AB9E15_02505 [Rhizobium leguminosarum]|uniref:hypothetical protein n=1 Tax=Rhizobium leguminosarum TaxID=384 RepID=UPI003F9CB3BA
MATSKKQKVTAFWWLAAITVAYFAFYYLLIIRTKACSSAPSQEAVGAIHSLLSRYLSCISINELGDALAGAFAPVAFLWLAGAVFIQSKELEAQRQELDETQEVMREQVEEMRASTALLREQTDVIKKDQLRKDQEQADRDFEGLCSKILARIREKPHLSVIFQYEMDVEHPDGRTVRGKTTSEFEIVPDTQKDLFYGVEGAQAVTRIAAAVKSLRDLDTSEIEVTKDSWAAFTQLEADVAVLCDTISMLSSHKHIQVSSGYFQRLHPRLRELIEELDRFC